MCYKSFALPKYLADHVEMYHSQKEPQSRADGTGGAGGEIVPPIFGRCRSPQNRTDITGGAGGEIVPPIVGRCRSKTFSIESPSITLTLSNLPAVLQNKVDIANGFKQDDKIMDTHENVIDQKEDIYIFTEEDNIPKLIQSDDITFNLTVDQLEPNPGTKI
jgi:hypothetical protein